MGEREEEEEGWEFLSWLGGRERRLRRGWCRRGICDESEQAKEERGEGSQRRRGEEKRERRDETSAGTNEGRDSPHQSSHHITNDIHRAREADSTDEASTRLDLHSFPRDHLLAAATALLALPNLLHSGTTTTSSSKVDLHSQPERVDRQRSRCRLLNRLRRRRVSDRLGRLLLSEGNDPPSSDSSTRSLDSPQRSILPRFSLTRRQPRELGFPSSSSSKLLTSHPRRLRTPVPSSSVRRSSSRRRLSLNHRSPPSSTQPTTTTSNHRSSSLRRQRTPLMNEELFVLLFLLLLVLVDFEHHLLEGRERSGHSGPRSRSWSGREGRNESSRGGRRWGEEVKGWEGLLLVEVWVEFGWRSVRTGEERAGGGRWGSRSSRERWGGGGEGLA